MNITAITPITEVHLLTGVPLDNTYKDTITFGDKTSQFSYFSSKTKTGCDFTNLTPVNLMNAMQLPINAYDIFDCNYLMFKNGNFSDKWLYAFITDIEFISINCCSVKFEIDVMQTWYFDYTLNESFVEREHVNDDTIGHHITEENIDTGEFINDGMVSTFNLSDLSIVIGTSSLASDGTGLTAGGLYCGVYSGVRYYAFASSDYGALNDMINTLCAGGKASTITTIFMMPTALVKEINQPANKISIYPVPRPQTIDGYTPKNKKLFCYPYNFIYATNMSGGSAVYKYEYFNQHSEAPYFELSGDMSPLTSVFLAPMNYKGISVNYDEKLVLNNYPLCNWTTNAYTNWVAQNKANLGLATASNILSIGVGAITKSPVAISTGVLGIANQLGQLYDRNIQPAQAHGSMAGGGSNIAIDIQDFFFCARHITAEYAQKIDNFFTMFGYKINLVKTPNRTGRPYWNYVKTNNCNCTGSIPFNDISKIRNIYDAGITFWHGDYVGNYALDNSI